MKQIRTIEELNQETKEGIVLIDFYADWCGHCVTFTPILEKVLKDHPGAFKVLKVDVDVSDELNEKFDIMSIPSLVLYKDGKVAKQHIGGLPEKDLIAFLGI